MLKAKDIMTRKVITVSPETRIDQAGKLLLENHFNGLPVVDQEGRLKGIISQDDLIAQQKKFPLPSVFTILDGVIPLTSSKHLEREIQKMAATTVGQAMTPDPIISVFICVNLRPITFWLRLCRALNIRYKNGLELSNENFHDPSCILTLPSPSISDIFTNITRAESPTCD